MGILVINADDFGMSQEVNEAIIYCLKNQLIDRTTLMVNMPYTSKAVQMAKEAGVWDKVGLHVNLVEGEALSDGIKQTRFCDESGYLNGSISLPQYKRTLLDKDTVNCIREEIDVQMKRFLSFGFPLRHVDSHQHSHVKPSVYPVFLKATKENGFRSIRLINNISHDRSKPLRAVYKSVLNRSMIRFNRNNAQKGPSYPLVSKACSYLLLKEELEKHGDALVRDHNVETWFHPALDDGKIVNLYYPAPFDIEEIARLRIYRNIF